MLRAILNKSCGQHTTKQQLYGHLPPISKIIQIRRTRHARHCWRRKDELISDVLQWTPSHGPARTYLQQLCKDTICNLENLPNVMDDRDEWRASIGEICASGTTWRWGRSIYLSMFLCGHGRRGINDSETLIHTLHFNIYALKIYSHYYVCIYIYIMYMHYNLQRP